MNKALPLASLPVLLLLAACGEPETVTAAGPADPDKDKVAAAPPVKLPPALLASKTYRCQPGNTLVYVDWFNDGTTATIKADKAGTPTPLAAPAAGQAYAGGDYGLEGTAEAATVKVTRAGKALTCKG